MKGIVLGGGKGTRMGILTEVTNKHLLPVWNKPMIFYPIETLLLSGATEICVIVGDNTEDFIRLLGDGSRFGEEVSITYRYQPGPLGIAEGINRCKSFVGNEEFMAICGDNFFEEMLLPIHAFLPREPYAYVWLYEDAAHATEYGNAVLSQGKIISLIEKPKDAVSPYILTGAYYFSGEGAYFDAFAKTEKSKRGEYEIVDVLRQFIPNIYHTVLHKKWIDMGTPERLLEIGKYLKEVNWD